MSSFVRSTCCMHNCLSLPFAMDAIAVAYNGGVKTKLIRIGKSYGVRIPKSFIELAGLGDSFHILVEGKQIVLRANKNPRVGWSKMFRDAIREHGNELTEEDSLWLNAALGPRCAKRRKSKSKSRSHARTRS